MPIAFDGTLLTRPRIISETDSPSINITIQCTTQTYADISSLIAKMSKILTSKITVNGKVKVDGDGVKGTVAMSTNYTRNITNCYIMPNMPIVHDAVSKTWIYTPTFIQDTTA